MTPSVAAPGDTNPSDATDYIFILFHQTGSEIHRDTDTQTQINTTHTNIQIYKYEHMNN